MPSSIPRGRHCGLVHVTITRRSSSKKEDFDASSHVALYIAPLSACNWGIDMTRRDPEIDDHSPGKLLKLSFSFEYLLYASLDLTQVTTNRNYQKAA
jgi:hypothetical protein